MDWDDHLQVSARTDIGMRRTNNQDSHVVVVADDFKQWQHRGHLFVVADGMGAHAAGELASQMAVESIPLTYFKNRDLPSEEALRSAIVEANRQIHERGEANLEFKGMGTTCSGLALLPTGAVVGHVGDSRVYRLRGDLLEQLSFDHSLVWELRSAGDFEDTAHLPKNIITRSLGPHQRVNVDLEGPFPLAVGDTFLLCSDGLSGEVMDDELGIIIKCLPPEEATRVLIDLANLRGGPDNITVVVVRVTSEVMPNAAQEAQPVAPQNGASKAVPVLWTLAALFAAVALGAVMGKALPLIVGAGIASIACGLIALIVHFSGDQPRKNPVRTRTAPLGDGPHTSCKCNANSKIVADLHGIADDLREGAEEADADADADFAAFDAKVTAARDAESRQDYTSAVRLYCQAISFMMSQLRGDEI